MAQERLGHSLITLTADFGDQFAQAQVALVVYFINPDARFLVVSNGVTPFSILEGALLAYQGSHGTLELARNFGSAAQTLQLKVGEKQAHST